jgi:hypothetical protein
MDKFTGPAGKDAMKLIIKPARKAIRNIIAKIRLCFPFVRKNKAARGKLLKDFSLF